MSKISVLRDLVSLADNLDKKGFTISSGKIDQIIRFNATNEIDQLRTLLFFEFKHLYQFLVRTLKNVSYFVKKDKQVVNGMLAEINRVFEDQMQNEFTIFDRERLEQYQAHLREVEQKIEELQQFPIEANRVIKESGLLFNEYNFFLNKATRILTDTDFEPVLSKMESLKAVLDNIIGKTTEDIADIDITRRAKNGYDQNS